jgi:hypothetical protein
MHKIFWSKNVKERDQLGDLDIDETVILMWILKAPACGLYLSGCDRIQWPSLKNMKMNIQYS